MHSFSILYSYSVIAVRNLTQVKLELLYFFPLFIQHAAAAVGSPATSEAPTISAPLADEESTNIASGDSEEELEEDDSSKDLGENAALFQPHD